MHVGRIGEPTAIVSESPEPVSVPCAESAALRPPIVCEPNAGEAGALATHLSGDPVADLAIVQAADLRAQRRCERERRATAREREQAMANAAYRKKVAAARARARSAWLELGVGVTSSAGGFVLERTAPRRGDPSFLRSLACALAASSPKLVELGDRAFGFAQKAEERELGSTRAENAADRISKVEADAADRVSELRRLEQRMLEILEQIRDGRERGTSTATSQRA